MKLIIKIILIGVITYFISPFTVWWVCMLVSFAVSFALPSSELSAFIAGLLGVGMVWMGYAWTLDLENASSFSLKIADLMGLKDPFMLVLATGIAGGVAGGFSSITGKTFRELFTKQKGRSLHS